MSQSKTKQQQQQKQKEKRKREEENCAVDTKPEVGVFQAFSYHWPDINTELDFERQKRKKEQMERYNKIK